MRRCAAGAIPCARPLSSVDLLLCLSLFAFSFCPALPACLLWCGCRRSRLRHPSPLFPICSKASSGHPYDGFQLPQPSTTRSQLLPSPNGGSITPSDGSVHRQVVSFLYCIYMPEIDRSTCRRLIDLSLIAGGARGSACVRQSLASFTFQNQDSSIRNEDSSMILTTENQAIPPLKKSDFLHRWFISLVGVTGGFATVLTNSMGTKRFDSQKSHPQHNFGCQFPFISYRFWTISPRLLSPHSKFRSFFRSISPDFF